MLSHNPSITRLCLGVLAALVAGGLPVRAQEVPKPEEAAPVPPGVTVSGGVEAYYTYNVNRPGSGGNSFLYNYRDGQLGLKLADIRIGKAATPQSRTGFLVRLIAGDVADISILPDDYEHVLEAYGTLLVPLGGRDLKVDVGQFVTHVGYETIEQGANPNFSGSFLFTYPIPTYNAGVRAAWPVGPATTITGFLLNRFNGTNDPGNREPGYGFQIAHTLSPAATLVLNGLGARENLGINAAGDPATNNRQQSLLDLIYTNQLTPSARVAVEGLYRWGDDVAGASYDVYGVAGFGALTLAGGNVLGLRAEILDLDAPGAALLAGASGDRRLWGMTATYELHSGLLPGLRTLLELRHDRADDPFFAGKNGGLKKSQTTLTIGQAYSF